MIFFLDQRKQAKRQSAQDGSIVHNLNKVRHEASRHFNKKAKEYLKLTIISKISETCRGASVTLRRITSLEVMFLKDEKGVLVTDSHSILARWRNHLSQLLNVHGVNDIRQTKME